MTTFAPQEIERTLTATVRFNFDKDGKILSVTLTPENPLAKRDATAISDYLRRDWRT